MLLVTTVEVFVTSTRFPRVLAMIEAKRLIGPCKDSCVILRQEGASHKGSLIQILVPATDFFLMR